MPQHPPAGGGGDGGQSSWTDPEACENTETDDRPTPGGARGDRAGGGSAPSCLERSFALGDAYGLERLAASGRAEGKPPREGEPGDASSFVVSASLASWSSSGQK
jgi:hypothetical protein